MNLDLIILERHKFVVVSDDHILDGDHVFDSKEICVCHKWDKPKKQDKNTILVKFDNGEILERKRNVCRKIIAGNYVSAKTYISWELNIDDTTKINTVMNGMNERGSWSDVDVEKMLVSFANDCDKDEELIMYEGHDKHGNRKYNSAKKWLKDYIDIINKPIELKILVETEYNGICSCPCHRGGKIVHIAACCNPSIKIKIKDSSIKILKLL